MSQTLHKRELLIDANPLVASGDILPVTDGFRFVLSNPSALVVNTSLSIWSRNNILEYSFVPQKFSRWTTKLEPIDYRMNLDKSV